MKKRMTSWIVGGAFAVSALGLAFGTSVVSAAEKNDNPPAAMHDMMKHEQMGTMNHEMMNSPEMQKKCLEMMKSPAMQEAMKGMLKQPEMQASMKQMLSSDPELRQIMSDLLKATETSEQDVNPAPTTTTSMEHSGHHM